MGQSDPVIYNINIHANNVVLMTAAGRIQQPEKRSLVTRLHNLARVGWHLVKGAIDH